MESAVPLWDGGAGSHPASAASFGLLPRGGNSVSQAYTPEPPLTIRLSSNGLGSLPFKEYNVGSNPISRTKYPLVAQSDRARHS